MNVCLLLVSNTWDIDNNKLIPREGKNHPSISKAFGHPFPYQDHGAVEIHLSMTTRDHLKVQKK